MPARKSRATNAKASANQPATNRRALLAAYRRMRPGVVRVTSAAASAGTADDFMRAAGLLLFETDGNRIILDSDDGIEKLADVVLFEPDRAGNRVYDRFLAEGAHKLAPTDREIAQKMQSAFFSLFRVGERHPIAGLWLEDLLDNDRRIWMVDEGLEASAREGLCMAARLFDAGDYHAGFGIIIPLSAPMVDSYTSLSTMPGMAPSGGFFVPHIYANAIHGLVA